MAAGTGQGFAGTVAALSVLDALQLHRSNHFSGSIAFDHRGQQATVYLQLGEVVHAEAGQARGEEALRAIADWPSGSLQAHANVSTFARTIDERSGRALLEALQLQAARRQAGATTPPPGTTPLPLATPVATASPLPQARPRGATERVRAVPGVNYAVVLRGGAPVNDLDPRAEALAQRSAYLLSKLAAPLSKALGLGDLTRGAIASQQAEQLLLFHAQEAYLAVSVAAGTPLQEAEAGVRRALKPGQAE